MKDKKLIKRRLTSLALCLAIAASLCTPAGGTFCERAYAVETGDELAEQLLSDTDTIPETYNLEDAPAPEETDISLTSETPAEPVQPEIPEENADPAQPEIQAENTEPAQPETPAENTEPAQPETPEPTPTEGESPEQPEEPTETENPEPTEAPAEEEEKKDGEEEKKEEPVIVYQTLSKTDAATGTTVLVTGDLPVGADVTITPVEVPEPMVQVLTLNLTEEEAQARQTIAYDVTLYDAEENVIEPTSPVDVQFKFGAGSPVDETVQNLAVIHLEEGADGINPVDVNAQTTVAEVADPAGTVSNEVVTSFAVESFSTFVITWTNKAGNETWFTVNVNYVNTNGEEIDLGTVVVDGEQPQGVGEISFDEGLNPSPIGGLVFKEARVGDALSGLPVTRMKVTQLQKQVDTTGWPLYQPVYKTVERATFYNGDTTTEVAAYDSDTTKEINVYLVYEAEGGNNPTAPNKPILDHNKTAERKEDGSYDITLDVKGTSSASTGQKKVDVLFILDKSGSMKYVMNENRDPQYVWGSGYEKSRLSYVQEAMGTFIDDMDTTPGIDARFDVVAFSEYPSDFPEEYVYPEAFVGSVGGWTDNAQTAKGWVNGITPKLGTNYQGGIYEGVKELRGARSDAELVVIFLTDGIPTYRGGMNGTNQYGNGQDDAGKESTKNANDYHFPDHQSPKGANIAAAEEQIKGMSCNQFYVIGVGPDFDTPTGYSNLQKLLTSANAASKPLDPQRVSGNPNDLNGIFTIIAENAKRFEASSVTITDNLSQYVDPVDGKPISIEVTKPGPDGKPVAVEPIAIDKSTEGKISITLPATDKNADAIITATVEGKQVKMDFPTDYKLEEGWTYSVTVKVKPTKEAYAADNSSYITGEAGTGTHAGYPGLPSNAGAELKYSFNNGPTEPPQDYPDPVIQVYPGALVIQKTIKGLTGNDLDTVKNKLYFNVTLGEGTAQTTNTYYLKNASDFTETTGANGEIIYTKTIANLIPETAYSVVEGDETLDGYTVTTSYTTSVTRTAEDGTVTTPEGTATTPPASGKIVEGETTTVSVMNEYAVEPKYKITVNKHLTKINYKMGDDATFLFEVVTPDGTYTRMMHFTTDDARDSFTITDLPAGQYTVRELPVAGYVETSGTYEYTFMLGPDKEVNFENKPTSRPDTPYGDSSSAKNMLTYVEGIGWKATPIADGNAHT